MKRVVYLAVIMAGVLVSSCGRSGGSRALKTDIDSVSYALGIEIGQSAFGLDSTMNPDVICMAVHDVFNKKGKMRPEMAYAYVQQYLTVGRARRNAAISDKWFKEVAGKKGVQKTASGLMYIIDQPGSEPKIQYGDSVRIHYTMKLHDGTIAQSNFSTDKTFDFRNTQDAVLKGLAEGIMLLGEGGKATFFVPWELAYGAEVSPRAPVGPKESAQYDVSIVQVIPNTVEQQ